MLNTAQYSKSKKLQDAAFVQIKNPETGELECTEGGEPIGVTLMSMQSKEFKRALRSTANLDLDKKEKEREKKINDWINEGTKPSDENLDFLEYCEKVRVERMQRVFAMVTTKLHNIELPADFAKEHDIKVGKAKEDGGCSVSFSVENIHKLYIALPDLSSQIGDGIAKQENFTKS